MIQEDNANSDKRGGKEERTETDAGGVYVLVLNSRSFSGPGTRDKRFRPSSSKLTSRLRPYMDSLTQPGTTRG